MADANFLLEVLAESRLDAADWEAVAEPLAELRAAWQNEDADRFRTVVEELSVFTTQRAAVKVTQPADPPPREILEVINSLVRTISPPAQTKPGQAKNAAGR
ncbi:CATRA system-associated protein [Catenulispora sp. GP43]|uniref:CATRA system-associated protein n=1 Tax=Catenulispora sp. GP43 TaxID=3156263 RepID=UPI003511DDC4